MTPNALPVAPGGGGAGSGRLAGAAWQPQIGDRVRLAHPSPLLVLSDDRGTIIRPDRFDGYWIVRLDAPASIGDAPDTVRISEIRDAVDNLEPIEAPA